MTKQKPRSARPLPEAEKWVEAKRLCRLSTRQIEMAKALGMNPKKLPGLRPSKSQPWKAPVGQFIEECYAKRFGDPPNSESPGRITPSKGTRTTRAGVSEAIQRAAVGVSAAASVRQRRLAEQACDLMVYLVNLADDIQATLAAAAVTPELLAALSTALHEVATRLTNDQAIPLRSEIDGLAIPEDTRQIECELDQFDDGDVPF